MTGTRSPQGDTPTSSNCIPYVCGHAVYPTTIDEARAALEKLNVPANAELISREVLRARGCHFVLTTAHTLKPSHLVGLGQLVDSRGAAMATSPDEFTKVFGGAPPVYWKGPYWMTAAGAQQRADSGLVDLEARAGDVATYAAGVLEELGLEGDVSAKGTRVTLDLLVEDMRSLFESLDAGAR